MKKNRRTFIWATAGLAGLGLAGKTAYFIAGRTQNTSSTNPLIGSSPLNWPWIVYNIGDELNHIPPTERVSPSAIRYYRWLNESTLDVQVREGERFPDSTLVNAASVKLNFEAGSRKSASATSIDPAIRCEIINEYTVRFHLPEPGRKKNRRV